MAIVLRCNFGDESTALIEYFHQKALDNDLKDKVFVVHIETGWAAFGWDLRVKRCFEHVERCNFIPVTLKPPQDFSEMVCERKNFPSSKFQWCVTFLKGLPFISWLDEVDPNCEWTIALPKRQALYSAKLSEFIPECEYHGDRKVWHPLINLNDGDRDALIQKAGFQVLRHRSLECAPCVKAGITDLQHLHSSDVAKTHELEHRIKRPMFRAGQFSTKPGIQEAVKSAKQTTTDKEPYSSDYSLGCGDPFGCGL